MSRAELVQPGCDQPMQNSLLSAMMQPEFYPKAPAEVSHRETHISHLFFAGDLVYKIKKPVRYSFLDYSSLEKRRAFLQAELRLNRRLAPSVYIGVLPIALDEFGWRLGGWSEPAEYTLVMRRLPEKRMMPFLLDTGQVTAPMMIDLADLLATFHRDAASIKNLDPERYVAAVSSQWSDNLAEIKTFVGRLLDDEDYAALARYGREFIEQKRQVFRKRVEQGWIRDVHGDLHCEHICYAPEGIQVFDCIEFSSKLRRCDLASEIGFLVMDLEARGGAPLVKPFLQRYQELLPDSELATLLPFAKCYRALVRGKVHALRGQTGFETARRYFRYAATITWGRFRPFLILISGLTGSGKSTLAAALSQRLGVTTINSDVVRKSFGTKAHERTAGYNQGLYSPTMTEKTYAKLARMAAALLSEGHGVIIDATFMGKAQRQKFIQLATKTSIPLLLIHCSASGSSTRDRLARRQAHGEDVSDGRWDIYLQQTKFFDPPNEITPAARFDINTEAPLESLVGECVKFLRGALERAQGERARHSNLAAHSSL